MKLVSKSMPEELIAGLDIGSSQIRIVIGQFSRNQETQQLNIIGVVEVPSQGVSKGSVVSIEDTVSSISTALEKAERMVGLPIENVWISIGGVHINSQESNGVIAIPRTSGEIQEEDIERVIDAAKSVAAPVNYDVLHVIPKTFTVDNQSGVKDPVGMTGLRLEVTTQVVRGLSSHIKNLTKCVYRTGLDINDIVLSSLAASEVVLNVRQKELGVALVDIGASTTNILVFEEGDVIHTAILPIGADHITADLAIGLQSAVEVAERVKLEYGRATYDKIDKGEEINLRDLGGDDQVFSKQYITEIINARVEEIFEKVDVELQKINRSGLLPAGIVLIGGGAKLAGILEIAKKKTMLPAAVGVVQNFNTAIDKVNDVVFVNSLGLVLWGYQMLDQKGRSKFNLGGKLQSAKDVVEGAKKWFKSLLS
ncbi:TPA: cell division protein FtsA [Candidatus Falkowbacteria bacterium]|nr:cell division protein FtsA [Candidatus Falkowbacteria bacterium]